MKEQPTFSKDSIRKEIERNRNYAEVVKSRLIKELQEYSTVKTSHVRIFDLQSYWPKNYKG